MGDREISTLDEYPRVQAVAFSGQTAGGSARQHNGNNYNNHTYHYTFAKRRSDETLREDGRNKELLRAVAEGQLPRVRHLLRIWSNIDFRDSEDLTALHQAVLSGFEDVVELLLDHGADVNAPSLSAGYPLCLAVLIDRFNIMKKLIEFRSDAKLADPELGTPLHCAGFTGNCEIVSFLLRHGAEPDPANRVDLQKLLPYRDSVSDDKLAAQDPWTSDHCWMKITPLIISVSATNLEMAELLYGLDGDRSPSSFEYNGFERSCFHSIHAAARWGSSEMMALTIMHSADVDQAESNGSTALIGATLNKRPDSVRQLLQAGASRNLCNSKGNTALILAGYFGFDDGLEGLISARASLDIPDKIGMTAIMRASSRGHESCVGRLAKAGASLDHHNADGNTALILASYHGFDGCVEDLIGARASLDLIDAGGETALMWASAKGHDDCVRHLIKAGASLDLYDTEKRTALTWASSNGHDECVRQLIEAGASVDQISGNDCTALIMASVNGRENCVEQLLRAGASLATKTKRLGSTALYEAVLGGHTRSAQMLCDHGANVNTQRLNGLTPLYCAAFNGQLECVQMLLERQADPNLAEEEGWTPLMIAILAAKPHAAAVVITLLHAGADVTARTDEGDTALHITAVSNQTQIAKVLLNSGASTSIMNTADERPPDVAEPDSAMSAFLRAWDEEHMEHPQTEQVLREIHESLPEQENHVGPDTAVSQIVAMGPDPAAKRATVTVQDTTTGQDTAVRQEAQMKQGTQVQQNVEKGKTRRKRWTHRLRTIDGLGYFR